MNLDTPSSRTLTLDGIRSRRSFLRGTAVVAAGAASVAAFGLPRQARADGIVLPKPPLKIVKIESMVNGALAVERVGAGRVGEPDRWRPTSHFWLENNGSGIRLVKIRVEYTGAGAPQKFDAGVDKWIKGHQTRVLEVPEPRLHEFPVPETMKITCFFENWGLGVSFEVPLAEFANEEAGGAYDFPGRAEDLPEGQFWFAGDNHGFGCLHTDNLSQRFAYDMGVARWSGRKWTDLRAPVDPHETVNGTKNDHFNIWGTPVYAVTDGVIQEAFRLKADNTAPGMEDSGGLGGNRLWVRSEGNDEFNGGYFLYAHLMAGSVPAALVPVEGGGGVAVKKGQFLGRVGNSGASSAPHLHIHFQRGKGESEWAQGLPLRFKNAQYRAYDTYRPGAFGPSDWNPNTTNAAIPNRTLVDAVGAHMIRLNPQLQF